MNSMTPEEATHRWCPFARASGPIVDNSDASIVGAVSVNRSFNGAPDRDSYCLAGRCMAWRWTGLNNGYCGLAGRPTDPPKE